MSINRQIIQDELVTAIKTVQGVDPTCVYTDFQNARDFDEIIERFRTQDATEMQFWRVRRVSYTPETAESTNRQRGIPIRHSVWWDGRFEVEFHMGYKETNEARFQEIIDNVLTALQPKRSYGVWSAVRPLGLELISTGNLGGAVLTRVAYFSLTITDPQDGIVPV